MAKHLLLIGGGHAHLTVLTNLDEYTKRGHRVTLVSPSPYHYYSGMGPGMLGSLYHPEQIRFPIKTISEARGAKFVAERAERIDPESRTVFLKSGHTLHYDILSCNTGSFVAPDSLDNSCDNAYPVKPIEMLLKARQHILELTKQGTPRILVIGGGPAGVEIAGNIWRLIKDHGATAQITMVAGRRLLARFCPKTHRLALDSLTRRSITVLEGTHVSRLEQDRVLLEDGRSLPLDISLIAVGIRPYPIFKDSQIPSSADGGLLVNSYLQSVGYPEIFGGGDCITFEESPLDKVGVYAVRQNSVLYHNLLAALEARELLPFQPQTVYLLIFNLGNGRGIFWRKNLVWEGRSCFWLKDYIDRKFMRKFLAA